MANRSYLYSLSNQPESYQDRPETITGLSEWPYNVPLVYYLLLSGNPRLCASLISDGFEDEAPDNKTRLYAITGDFATGYARLERFAKVLRRAAPAESTQLRESITEALGFLASHRERYFLLETIELDLMNTSSETALRAVAEEHLAAARAAGAAVDALSCFDFLAARQLRSAVQSGDDRLAPFKGLSLADDFDHVGVERVMGMGYWDTVLYFSLWNREEFEAQQALAGD
ncbi:DUF7822 domain-containing protein [Pseudomonas schmalbachii]|uniref:DUF7822 domain-containing protein n=1 Tax=Pseudomonas schmalbachii TaxID=2816993 RepID=A0ABS3TIZ9_9PSED|nr:hypothetical protein [Pseudomonas schmalbachii]MBO3273622.1 hypothetical protein [Pseudomonas schmalbachii]